MAAGDVWGNTWLASWGNSWAQAEAAPEVTEESPTGGFFTRPSEKETASQRKARIHAERVRLGIVEVPRETPKEPTKPAPEPNYRRKLALLEDERTRLITYLEAMAEQDAKRRRVTALLLLML